MPYAKTGVAVRPADNIRLRAFSVVEKGRLTMKGRKITVTHENFEDLLKDAKDIAAGVPVFRWPRDDDTLLPPRDDDTPFRKWRRVDNEATFSKDAYSRHVHIWDGFAAAGDMLAEIALQDVTLRQLLVYPIIYNYRHSVELGLKWFVDHYSKHISSTSIKTTTTHNLLKLWEYVRNIIETVDPDNKNTSNIERVIRDLDALDNSSYSFRYSYDNKGHAISISVERIDLQNLCDVMEAVKNYFNDLDGWLNARLGCSET